MGVVGDGRYKLWDGKVERAACMPPLQIAGKFRTEFVGGGVLDAPRRCGVVSVGPRLSIAKPGSEQCLPLRGKQPHERAGSAG